MQMKLKGSIVEFDKFLAVSEQSYKTAIAGSTLCKTCILIRFPSKKFQYSDSDSRLRAIYC